MRLSDPQQRPQAQRLLPVLGRGCRILGSPFGWRALLKIKHVPEQLFDVTMFPIMFLLLVFGPLTMRRFHNLP